MRFGNCSDVSFSNNCNKPTWGIGFGVLSFGAFSGTLPDLDHHEWRNMRVAHMSAHVTCALCTVHLSFSPLLPRDVIMMAHQITVIVTNGMVKYYGREFISTMIAEAIKFCAPLLHYDS